MCRCVQAERWCDRSGKLSCGAACGKLGAPQPSNYCVPATPVAPLNFAVTSEETVSTDLSQRHRHCFCLIVFINNDFVHHCNRFLCVPIGKTDFPFFSGQQDRRLGRTMYGHCGQLGVLQRRCRWAGRTIHALLDTHRGRWRCASPSASLSCCFSRDFFFFFFSHSFQKPLLLEIIIYRIANAHMIISTLFLLFQVLKRSAQHLVCAHACV